MRNRIISAAVIIFMLTPMFSVVQAEGTAVLNFTVDESTVIKHLDKKLYGINFEWGQDGDGSGYYIEPVENSLKPNPAYINCFKNYMPFSRMAGMSANSMYWKKAIGTLAEREEQQFWYYSAKKQRFGPVEWVKGNLTIDPYGEFAYTVNLKDLDNLADLVRFLRLLPSDPNAVGTDGVNWAQRRVDLGIENPVPIAVWELGNEVDCSTADGGFSWKISNYLPACQEAISIISAIEPDAKFSVQVKSDYWVTGWQNWHRTLLREIGDEIDYISVHQYYSWERQDVGANSIFQKLEAEILQYTGENRIKFYVSEHSVSPPLRTWSTSFEYMVPHTLGGTLATADFFLRSAMRPSIAMATYHTTQSASWVTAYEFRGDVKLTAVGNLLHIMYDNFCGDFLSSTLDGYDIDTNSPASAGAVKTDEGINVMLLNRGDSAVQFKFHFDKHYNLNTRSYITAPTYKADNYQLVDKNTGATAIDKQEITYAYDEPANVADITSYTVEPYTMIMLNLKEVKSSLSNDFEGYNISESYNSSSFTDENEQGVSGSYYNAVINNAARKDSDYSGSVYAGGVYEGNAANNIWTYNDLKRRVYGGLKGYNGYVYPDDVNCSYNRWNHRLSVASVAGNTTKALIFLPTQRNDASVTSCFGVDNITTAGGGWLKADLAFFKDLPEAKIQLTVNPTGQRTCEKSFDIVKFSSASYGDRTADITFDGLNIGNVSVPETTSEYQPYHIEYGYSDNTHSLHRLIVTDALTGGAVADSGWRANANKSYFDDGGVFGLRFMLSTLKRSEPRMYLDNLSYSDEAAGFSGNQNIIYSYKGNYEYSSISDSFYAYTTDAKSKVYLIVNNKLYARTNTLFYAEYDGSNRLVNIRVLKSVNTDIDIGGNAEYARVFLYTSAARLKPLCESLRIDYH